MTATKTIDDERFTDVYRLHWPRAVRLASRLGARDPEGVANSAMLDFYRSFDPALSRDDAALSAYITRTVRNATIAEHRRSVDTQVFDPDDDALAVEPDSEALAESMWLREVIDELSPAQRDVIQARFLDDLSGSEVAERLGKDRNAVYQLQHRALSQLRKRLLLVVLGVLAVVAAWAIQQVADQDYQVDSSPVDGPAVTSPRPTIDDRESIEPDQTTPITAATEDVSIERAGPEAIVAGDIGPTLDGAIDSSDPEPEAETVTPSTSVDPQPESESDSDLEPEPLEATPASANPSPNTTATTAAPTTVVPTPAMPTATALNACTPFLTLDTVALKLYDPLSRRSLVDAFVAPQAVRLLDVGGRVLTTIDTSDQTSGGAQAGSYGWIGTADGGRAYADYASAPLPGKWGVVVDRATVDGWATVEYRAETEGPWIAITACA